MTENFPQGMLRRVLVVGDSQKPGEFRLEMAQCPHAGPGLVDVIQCPRQQVMEFRIRMFRLHGGFQKLAAVSGQQGGGVMFAQSFPPMVDRNFAKRVEIPSTGSHKIDLSAEKQVQFPSKRALGTKCTFGRGFDQPVIGGKPMDDQAGVRQTGQTGQDRRHPITLNLSGKEMKPKSRISRIVVDETFLLLMRLSRNKKGA